MITRTNSFRRRQTRLLLGHWSRLEIHLFLSSWTLFDLDITSKRKASASHECTHLRENPLYDVIIYFVLCKMNLFGNSTSRSL